MGPIVSVPDYARERGARAKRDARERNVVLRDEAAIRLQLHGYRTAIEWRLGSVYPSRVALVTNVQDGMALSSFACGHWVSRSSRLSDL